MIGRRARLAAPGAHRSKLTVLSICYVVAFSALIARLFYVQIISHAVYQAEADKQHRLRTNVAAARGQILARDHTNEGDGQTYTLATNKTFYELYLNPTEITRPINTAQLLSEVLGVPYDDVLRRAEKENDIYEPVPGRATAQQLEKIRESGLTGIHATENAWRYYPDGEAGSHVLGFYGIDGDRAVGKYGIEGYWENDLAGMQREILVTKDGRGQTIPDISNGFKRPVDGSDIVLTIDRTAQYEVCRILKQGMERYGADKATVIVMESSSGRIIAMCNYPAFDPNSYYKVPDVSYFNNDAVFEAYEPGSVFKPVSMSIAIDLNQVTPTTIYEDKGDVKVDDRTIHNFDNLGHGTRTMTQVLQESLNTGAVFATRNVPNLQYFDYVKRFGIGEKTGIEISQESAGSLGQLSKGRDIYKATSSFGQGISVTPLQMLAAINVFAHDGELIKPYIIDEIRKPNGETVITRPSVTRQVVKKETARTIAAMLTQVAEEGYDKKAAIAGYYVAGKTGTAQIAENGQYGSKTNHTFVGFAPSTDAKFSIIIKMNNVKNVGFAADSTTPLFNQMARFLLQYYRIAPTR